MKKIKTKVINKIITKIIKKLKTQSLAEKSGLKNTQVFYPFMRCFFSMGNSVSLAIKKIRKLLVNKNPTKNGKFNNVFFSKLAIFAFKENCNNVVAKMATKHSKIFRDFIQKLGMVVSKVENVRLFYLKKPESFTSFFKQKTLTESHVVGLLINLLTLLKTINNVYFDIQRNFSTKFVGQKAYLIIRYFLDIYKYVFDCWLDLERRGVFNQLISFKNVTKLMRYFWYPVKRRKFLREPLLQRASLDKIFVADPKKLQRLGFPMFSLRFTDTLFFWHAYTRKRILQNMWLFRSKKFFSRISNLKKNRQAILKIIPKIFIFSHAKFTEIYHFLSFFMYNVNFLSTFCFKLNFKLNKQFTKLFVKNNRLKKKNKLKDKFGFSLLALLKQSSFCLKALFSVLKHSFCLGFIFVYHVRFSLKEFMIKIILGFFLLKCLVNYIFFCKNRFKFLLLNLDYFFFLI